MKASFFTLVGLVALMSGAGPAPPILWDPCAPDQEPEPITLQALWLEGAAREPGFRAGALRVASSERRQSASQRALLPSFGLEGMSNYGQRVSPGEERVLGVGPRSELRLVGEWIWLDPARGGDRAAAGFETEARRAEEVVRAGQWQAERGRAYAAAVWTEARLQALEAHMALLETLRSPVALRVQMGVESPFEAQQLSDALTRATRLLDEARAQEQVARAELSLTVGRCVRAIPMEAGSGMSDPHPADGPSPELVALRAQAQASEARARATADAGRWQLGLIGSVGPTRSRAFTPDPVETESLIGVMASLRLDPGGQFRLQREAGVLEARALTADAEQRAAELSREAARLRTDMDQLASTLVRLAEEDAARTLALEASRLRWEAGVDGWAPLVQAADQSLSHTLTWLDAIRARTELDLRYLELGLPIPEPIEHR